MVRFFFAAVGYVLDVFIEASPSISWEMFFALLPVGTLITRLLPLLEKKVKWTRAFQVVGGAALARRPSLAGGSEGCPHAPSGKLRLQALVVTDQERCDAKRQQPDAVVRIGRRNAHVVVGIAEAGNPSKFRRCL